MVGRNARRAELLVTATVLGALVSLPLTGAAASAPAAGTLPAVERTGSAPGGNEPARRDDVEPVPDEPDTPPATELPAESGVGPATRMVHFPTTVGRSARGRPIRAWFVGDAEANRVLVVLGQMHGDEKAGKATAAWVRDHVRPKKGTAIWTIPTMNPDGDAAGRRGNGRGVDLNRNWPTSGWQVTPQGSRYWSGPRPGSEPETKAMMAFLRRIKPDYVASIHQPLHGVGKTGEDVPWERRLARHLRLPRKYFGIAQGKGVSPTLTGWYNHRFGKHGTATTIEYGVTPGKRYRTRVAGLGITRAAKVR